MAWLAFLTMVWDVSVIYLSLFMHCPLIQMTKSSTWITTLLLMGLWDSMAWQTLLALPEMRSDVSLKGTPKPTLLMCAHIVQQQEVCGEQPGLLSCTGWGYFLQDHNSLGLSVINTNSEWFNFLSPPERSILLLCTFSSGESLWSRKKQCVRRLYQRKQGMKNFPVFHHLNYKQIKFFFLF